MAEELERRRDEVEMRRPDPVPDGPRTSLPIAGCLGRLALVVFFLIAVALVGLFLLFSNIIL